VQQCHQDFASCDGKDWTDCLRGKVYGMNQLCSKSDTYKSFSTAVKVLDFTVDLGTPPRRSQQQATPSRRVLTPPRRHPLAPAAVGRPSGEGGAARTQAPQQGVRRHVAGRPLS